MTPYEQLKTLLELNVYKGVAMQNKITKEYKVFTYLRPDGYVEGTCLGRTIEKCLSKGLSGVDYTKQNINEYWENPTPIPMKPKVLPVGTKVRILEIAREVGGFDEWENKKKEMVGKIGVITEVNDGSSGVYYGVWNGDKTVWLYIPAYAVAPVFEEEKPDTWNELKQLADKMGYELIKKQTQT